MYRTWLIPYLEDALDAEGRRQLEARLAEDPALRAELAALRRTQPRLHEAALHLRQLEAAAPAPAPLWPHLREHLETRPARPQHGPATWWFGGLCAASVLVLAVVLGPKLHMTRSHPQLASRKTRATVIALAHRNNSVGTPTARKLQNRALQVAAIKQAAQTRTAALPHLATPRPSAPPPKAPPLPGGRLAGKLPMPVAPPVLMAKREPDQAFDGYYDHSLAPTHSPPTHSGRVPAEASQPVRVSGKRDSRKVAGTDDTRAAIVPSPSPAQPRSHRTQEAIDHTGTSTGSNSPTSAPASPQGFGGGGFAAHGDGPQGSPPPVPLRPFAGPGTADGSGDAAPLSLRQRLERTVTQPQFGTSEGEQQLQRVLQDAQQAGTLDALASQLEQTPVSTSRAAAQEVVLGRMRAAVYDAAGDPDRALAERRAIALLPTANGEDWFELAQTESRLGNIASAQRAYAQALRAPGIPLSAAHRAIAHRNLP